METLILIQFAILSGILRGFVLKSLWSWFIVPQFHIAPLTVPVALGISVIVGLLTTDTTKAKDNTQTSGIMLAVSIMFTSLCWGMGWIYHLFM